MLAKCLNINLLLLIYFYIISFNNFDPVVADVSGTYIACYRERTGTARLLHQAFSYFDGKLTPEVCINFCRTKGYAYAGVELWKECFCSSWRPPFRYMTEEEECDAKCQGDEKQICGGAHRLNVYETYELQTNPVENNYLGCVDTSRSRALIEKSKTYSEILTPEICVAYCFRNGFRFAALQNRECFCGNVLGGKENEDSCNCISGNCEDEGANLITKDKVRDQECNIKCGNKRFSCGGQVTASVYTTGITGYSEEDALLGCYEDNGARILSGFELKFLENNTPKLCYNVCRGLGFKYAGVEVGVECYCGNVRPDLELRRPESDCAMPCAGDPSKGCGGNWRIYVYSVDGSQ